ncbi:MAG TPA: permease-like cell division protein FtsX [Gaiellaceae bacterium]|jgi:cell division protein FtsX
MRLGWKGLLVIGCVVGAGAVIGVVFWPSERPQRVVRIDFTTLPQATRVQEEAVAGLLALDPHVSAFKFVPKSAALAAIKRNEPKLVERLPYNPLPDSITVTLKSDRYAPSVIAAVRPLAGVQIVLSGVRR